MWWLFLLVGVGIQVALARYTASDAYKRGAGGRKWFFTVLIFGVIGVLFYLLSRPDERLPPEEQSPNAVDTYLRKTIIYGSGSIIGLFIAYYGYAPLVEVLFPIPNIEQCGGVSIIDTTDTTTVTPSEDPCAITESRSDQIHQNRQTFGQGLFLGGFFIPPIGTYLISRYGLFE
jgi:hypothetical protein